FAANRRRMFAVDTYGAALTTAADLTSTGAMSGELLNPWSPDTGREAKRTWISSDEATLVDNSGLVFDTDDLSYRTSLSKVLDLAQGGGGQTVILRGLQLLLYDHAWREGGLRVIIGPARAGCCIGDTLILLRAPESAEAAVSFESRAVASLQPRDKAPLVAAENAGFDGNDILMGKSGGV